MQVFGPTFPEVEVLLPYLVRSASTSEIHFRYARLQPTGHTYRRMLRRFYHVYNRIKSQNSLKNLQPRGQSELPKFFKREHKNLEPKFQNMGHQKL